MTGPSLPFLRYELLQALKRASEVRERGRELERDLEAVRARGDAEGELSFAVGRRGDTSLKDAYAGRLRIAEAAYSAMKRRCAVLEERCESLLATIERAAFDGEPENAAAAAPDTENLGVAASAASETRSAAIPWIAWSIPSRNPLGGFRSSGLACRLRGRREPPRPRTRRVAAHARIRSHRPDH